MNNVGFVISKGGNFIQGPERVSVTQSFFLWQKFYFSEKGLEKASDVNIRSGAEFPFTSLNKRAIYFFNWLLTIDQKNVSGCKRSYQIHSNDIHVKITGLELTVERSYQTHSHSIHFKITGLVRRFLRKNVSSSRIHCCYIITSTEFKGKHTLGNNELFCCVINSSAHNENNVFCE